MIVAGVVVLALAVPAAAQAGSEPDPILDGVGDARARHGLAPLRASHSLRRSASAFAGRLMRTQRFAHAKRIHASSRFHTLGETLAIRMGARRWRPCAVVRAWLRSAGHRALLLSPAFRYAGAGYSHGRFGGRRAVIWVLHLGTP
jgi:streptogrisin C